MRAVIRALLWLALPLFASSAYASPTQTNSTTVDAIKTAIAAQDFPGLKKIDNPIEYIPVWDGRLISSDDALKLLHGCQAKGQSVDSMRFTIVMYSCPSRENKLECTTGDLRLMIYDDNNHTEIGISEQRVFTGDCPRPPAPAMPAAFEVSVASAVAQTIVDGVEPAAQRYLSNSVQVARAAKYATGSPEVEFQERGYDAFTSQVRYLVSRLGRPKSTTCDAQKSICQFDFDQKDRFLFAAMPTRNHQVEFVQFFYSSRAMILERMRQQGQ